jgi:hypothetical protein
LVVAQFLRTKKYKLTTRKNKRKLAQNKDGILNQVAIKGIKDPLKKNIV